MASTYWSEQGYTLHFGVSACSVKPVKPAADIADKCLLIGGFLDEDDKRRYMFSMHKLNWTLH